MKTKLLLLLIFIVIIIAGAIVGYRVIHEPSDGSLNQAEVQPSTSLGPEEEQVQNFVRDYLTAYQSVYEKKNFAEVKKFIADEVLVQMARESTPFETNATDFDSFEIGEAVKANHEPYAAEVLGWEVQVKLFKDGQMLWAEPTSISVIKENGTSTGSVWKTTSWYFAE